MYFNLTRIKRSPDSKVIQISGLMIYQEIGEKRNTLKNGEIKNKAKPVVDLNKYWQPYNAVNKTQQQNLW
jgi:hypothetical protein